MSAEERGERLKKIAEVAEWDVNRNCGKGQRHRCPCARATIWRLATQDDPRTPYERQRDAEAEHERS